MRRDNNKRNNMRSRCSVVHKSDEIIIKKIICVVDALWCTTATRPSGGGGEGGKEEHSVLIGHMCTCTVTYVLKKMTFTTTFPVFFAVLFLC